MTRLYDCVAPPLLLIGIVLILTPEPVNHRVYAAGGKALQATLPPALSTLMPASQRQSEGGASDKQPDQPDSGSIPQVAADAKPWKKLDLEATAYNSVAAQTDSTPDIAAWGDKLRPGMKAIAVSRDLLKMGLKRGTRVRISGMEGEYVVLDKMNKRWTRRIDVYMGEDVRAALKFGKRDVVLHYRPKAALLVADNH